jgi:hypothetical protein
MNNLANTYPGNGKWLTSVNELATAHDVLVGGLPFEVPGVERR